MALFAGDPAGVQIKKWLIILVSLIVLVNVLAAASLLALQRSVRDIQGRYQPVMIAAGDISTQVYQAQTSLYKYLGEYLPDKEELATRTAALEETVAEALSLEGAGEWRPQLEAVKDGLARYRVVVRNLPAIGAETDWEEVDEFRAQALALGGAMEEGSSTLEEEVGARIREKTARSLRLSRAAVVIFLCLLGLSTLITALLLAWWKQFQDMILNL